MKLGRFQLLHEEPGQEKVFPRYGILEGDHLSEIASPFDLPPHSRLHVSQISGGSWPLSDLKLLPPCEPGKIVCVGRNYTEHAAEFGNDVPKEPLIFLKPPSSILAPGDPILLTPHSERVDYEGELAIVIGKTCSRLKNPADASSYILGYTCLNDVTARDLQKRDVQFTRAKGFDTFCPFGPFIETELNLSVATVETFLNGKKRQSARIAEMIFPVDVIIQWISQMMTLLPGDVISTGTPSGVGPLAAGDVVEVAINGVGTLRNPVRNLVGNPVHNP
ncbi:MAG TPA: fumarylacetoacetate hydrolase family protein [Candidatus Acidoferrales bacterium]|nr:fumarylacetoacetate hydrolase family protein [Candidatus Acidoferrales bacterium]